MMQNKLNPILFLEKTKQILRKYDERIVKMILLEVYVKKRKLKRNPKPSDVKIPISRKLKKENLHLLHFDLLIEESISYMNEIVLIDISRKEKKVYSKNRRR